MLMSEVDGRSFEQMVKILDLGGDNSIPIEERSNEWDLELLTEKDKGYLLTGLYARRKTDVIKELMRKGIDINSRTSSYQTLLDDTILGGDYEMTKMLVEAGANVFQINSEGKCKLCKATINKPLFSKKLFKYLIELGLNPYNNCLKNSTLSFRTEDGETITIETLQQWSQHTEADDDYKTPFFDGNYELSISILERTLNRLGPIISNTPASLFVEETLEHYRMILQLAGKVEQSNAVASFIYENHSTDHNYNIKIRNALVVNTLFQNDNERMSQYNKSIREYRVGTVSVIGTYVMDYLYEMRNGNNKTRKATIMRSLKRFYKNDVRTFTSKVISNVLLFDDCKEELEAYLENKNMLPNIHAQITNYYIIYLIDKKDYVTAKYFAFKIKELDLIKVEIHDYYLTLMLLAYIEELETPAA